MSVGLSISTPFQATVLGIPLWGIAAWFWGIAYLGFLSCKKWRWTWVLVASVVIYTGFPVVMELIVPFAWTKSGDVPFIVSCVSIFASLLFPSIGALRGRQRSAAKSTLRI